LLALVLTGDRYSTGAGSFSRKQIGRRQVTLINAIFFKDSGFEYVDSRSNIVTQGVELMWLIGASFRLARRDFWDSTIAIHVSGLVTSQAKSKSF
jgi:hypothetical protein